MCKSLNAFQATATNVRPVDSTSTQLTPLTAIGQGDLAVRARLPTGAVWIPRKCWLWACALMPRASGWARRTRCLGHHLLPQNQSNRALGAVSDQDSTGPAVHELYLLLGIPAFRGLDLHQDSLPSMAQEQVYGPADNLDRNPYPLEGEDNVCLVGVYLGGSQGCALYRLS